MTRLTALATFLVLLGLSSAAYAQSEPEPITTSTKVRSLAENVLGTGLIRSIAVTEDGATILMRWEAATYRRQLKQGEAREQLFGEAELVTGSIMGGIRSVSRRGPPGRSPQDAGQTSDHRRVLSGKGLIYSHTHR